MDSDALTIKVTPKRGSVVQAETKIKLCPLKVHIGMNGPDSRRMNQPGLIPAFLWVQVFRKHGYSGQTIDDGHGDRTKGIQHAPP